MAGLARLACQQGTDLGHDAGRAGPGRSARQMSHEDLPFGPGAQLAVINDASMAVQQDAMRMARALADGPPAIACTGLTKDYGQGHGIFGLDLTVSRGGTFGFIGPNGAGKTTTIRLLMDFIRPTRGRAEVLVLDAVGDSLAIKRRVGYLPGELVQFPSVTAGYVIGMLAGLRGGVAPERISALAERFEIDLGRKYETLSHGNKQKVGLIQAFMHEPELLILDEPTMGLDPLMQREFRLLVQESVARGATVFLSSHVLSEVELICDRIGLIREGRLLRVGSLADFRSLRIHRVEAVFTGHLTAADLEHVPGVTEPKVQGNVAACAVRGSVAPLLATLSEAGVTELDSHELSLEEVFLAEFEGASPVRDRH